MNTVEKLIALKKLESKVRENQTDILKEILESTRDGTLTWERTTITSEKEVFETTNLGEYTWVYTVKREGYIDGRQSLVLWKDTEEDRRTVASSLNSIYLNKLESTITAVLVSAGRGNLVRMLEVSGRKYVKDCLESFYKQSSDSNGYNDYFLDIPEISETHKVERPSGLWYWSCRIECILRDNSDSIIPKAKPGEIACAMYKFLELKGINIRNWETTKSDKLCLDLYASYEESEEQ